MPELFKGIWIQWNQESPGAEARRADLEQTTQAGDASIDAALRDPGVRQAIEALPTERRARVPTTPAIPTDVPAEMAGRTTSLSRAFSTR